MSQNTDKARVALFKRNLSQSQKEKIRKMAEMEDETLVELLNRAVLPNSLSVTAVKHAILLHFVVAKNGGKREELKKFTDKVFKTFKNTPLYWKSIIKFGIYNDFNSGSWRHELRRYITTPVSSGSSSGRKIISSAHFREAFFFAKNLLDRAKENKRLPRM